jgi:DNA-binding NarL/FixJ family response regulator
MTTRHLSPRGRPKPLSPREQAVLALLGEGLTNTEVAASLDIARSTVKRRVSSIMWKLEVHTRREAVSEASRQVESSYLIEELRSAPGWGQDLRLPCSGQAPCR